MPVPYALRDSDANVLQYGGRVKTPACGLDSREQGRTRSWAAVVNRGAPATNVRSCPPPAECYEVGVNNESADPWGSHASTYDRIFAPLTGYVARTMLATTEERTPNGAHLLDIGCGSGALLLPAIERADRRRAQGHGDVVVGCDVSPGMVAMARKRAEALFESGAFRCEVQDGQSLSEDDFSYDAVFSCFGIFLFPERRAGWREAARVLKSGGIFSTSTWLPPEENEMFRAQFAPIMEALPSRLTEGMAPAGWLEVATGEALEAEVRDAGFEDLETSVFRTMFALPSAAVAWNAVLDNPAAGALVQQCTEQEREVVKSAFFESMQRRAGGPQRPILLEAACNILVARRS